LKGTGEGREVLFMSKLEAITTIRNTVKKISSSGVGVLPKLKIYTQNASFY
jgi:hypothetical protein